MKRWLNFAVNCAVGCLLTFAAAVVESLSDSPVDLWGDHAP